MVFTEKEQIFFLFYCLYIKARFWRHKKCHQTKHERHGVDAQCLTYEPLERQKQKVSVNQNNFDTKMFLTF